MALPHDGMCEDLAERDPDCYRCKIAGFGVMPSATPTRTANRTQPIRPVQQPSWEKGRAGEHRPGGTFMPYLAGTRPIPVKEFAEKRTALEAERRRQLNATAPLT